MIRGINYGELDHLSVKPSVPLREHLVAMMHPFGPTFAKMARGTTSAKKVVNIKKIAAYSKEGDSV